MNVRLRKLGRFVKIYGLRRTFYKVCGRARVVSRPWRRFAKGNVTVGIIGCGQFAFSTIGFFLEKSRKAKIVACYDVDPLASQSFAKFYGLNGVCGSSTDLIESDAIDVVYIASNHASHSEYAIRSVQAGKCTYIEKPAAVSFVQLKALSDAIAASRKPVFVGYNRPYSAAIGDLRARCQELNGPLTLSCFVSGHVLPSNNWYRNAEEGSRICGNVGHWIDLLVHILSWGELPDRWDIELNWSNRDARDDDLVISLVSERGDLANIVMTSRTEPFEGINESINFQWGSTIAKIDDFRRMTIWREDETRRFRYWPKNVGHERSISQPFESGNRSWHEVELSTLLMLKIAEMVALEERRAPFSFSSSYEYLGLRQV